MALWKACIKEKTKTPLERELNYSLISQASEGKMNLKENAPAIVNSHMSTNIKISQAIQVV